MKLLVLVVCLLIERYLHIGNTLRRFSWFESYLNKLQTKIKKDSVWSKGLLGLVLILLPLCLPLIIVENFVVGRQYALSGAGLYFLVLLYCFGPTDLYYQLYQYFTAVEGNDKEHQVCSYNEMMDNEVDNNEELLESINEQELTETIFTRVNCGIFGVVFWFCFGPLFLVVIYRVLCLMSSFVTKGKDVTKPFEEVAPLLYGWLNWIPARVMALLYVLAGGFRAFSTWRQYVFTGPDNNQIILIKCGMDSLLIDQNAQVSSIDQNKQAVTLVNRAVAIFIVVMFVFLLGGWI